MTVQSTTSLPQLNRGDIHIWRADENFAPHQVLDVLSPDELKRADSFHFEHDRRRFMCCRGLLRKLLGHYLACSPKDLAFEYTNQGKPALPGNPVHFNVSHTAGLSLIAFAMAQPIGVDVESIERQLNFEAIAQRHFSSQDAAAVRSSSPAQRAKAFYAHWTAHEACLKAQGQGIGSANARDVQCQWICPLNVGPRFAAAIAAREAPTALDLYQA